MARRFFQAGRDPFPPTADPTQYVPRTATEAVLLQLEMALEDGSSVALLEGEPGSGRTLLLRVLVSRLTGRLVSFYLPYPKLAPGDLWQWVAAAWGERYSEQPELAVRARISREACEGLPPRLFLIDDAGWLPPESLEQLLELQSDYPDGMRTLLVVPEGFGEEPIAAAGLRPERVTLAGEMDAGETDRYLRSRLSTSAAGPVCRERIEKSLQQLYRQSRGNPGRLHVVASRLLLRAQLEIDTRSAAEGTLPARPQCADPHSQGDLP